VKTDIQIEIPEGCYDRVAPRSGLAAKNFIDVGANVNFKDCCVVMFNHPELELTVAKGDRIAQLICETLEEMKSLSDTQRGTGGFGSTETN